MHLLCLLAAQACADRFSPPAAVPSPCAAVPPCCASSPAPWCLLQRWHCLLPPVSLLQRSQFEHQRAQFEHQLSGACLRSLWDPKTNPKCQGSRAANHSFIQEKTEPTATRAFHVILHSTFVVFAPSRPPLSSQRQIRSRMKQQHLDFPLLSSHSREANRS